DHQLDRCLLPHPELSQPLLSCVPGRRSSPLYVPSALRPGGNDVASDGSSLDPAASVAPCRKVILELLFGFFAGERDGILGGNVLRIPIRLALVRRSIVIVNEKPRVGFVGVGLMGHGAAKNILERGKYPLTILGHRNRTPVDDLVARGAKEASDAAALV